MVSKAQLDELLSDDVSPNEPLAMPEQGLSGRQIKRPVSEPEMRRRREAVANLLMSGYSRDRIVDTMTLAEIVDEKTGKTRPGFGLTEREVDRLIDHVRTVWKEEGEVEKEHAKAATIKRIHREINEARQIKAYGAIANLEKVLMMVQGTAEPLEGPAAPVDSRVTDALLTILNERDPVHVREMIRQEMAIEKVSGGAATPVLSADFPKPKKG